MTCLGNAKLWPTIEINAIDAIVEFLAMDSLVPGTLGFQPTSQHLMEGRGDGWQKIQRCSEGRRFCSKGVMRFGRPHGRPGFPAEAAFLEKKRPQSLLGTQAPHAPL